MNLSPESKEFRPSEKKQFAQPQYNAQYQQTQYYQQPPYYQQLQYYQPYQQPYQQPEYYQRQPPIHQQQYQQQYQQQPPIHQQQYQQQPPIHQQPQYYQQPPIHQQPEYYQPQYYPQYQQPPLMYQQPQQSLLKNIEKFDKIYIHGSCLDGALSALILTEFKNLENLYYQNKFYFIPPGKPVINAINGTQDQEIVGFFDLAMPEFQKISAENKKKISWIVDHHPSTEKYANKENFDNPKIENIIYDGNRSTSFILLQELGYHNDPKYGENLFIRAINLGDQGKLSLDSSDFTKTELFVAYVGLQKLLEIYKYVMYKKVNKTANIRPNWKMFPGLLRKYILPEITETDFSRDILALGAISIIREYNYIKDFSVEEFVKEVPKIEGNLKDTILYIPKRDGVTPLIAGIMMKDVGYVGIFDKNNKDEFGRLSIRGITGNNAHKLAKKFDEDGGGHFKASSAKLPRYFEEELPKHKKYGYYSDSKKYEPNQKFLPKFSDGEIEILEFFSGIEGIGKMEEEKLNSEYDELIKKFLVFTNYETFKKDLPPHVFSQ